MEELFSKIELSIDDVKKKFYGVATGKVVDVVDPLGLGRVKVQLPFIDSVDLSPWARVATLMAGFGHGSYFLPNVGQEVLLAFEHGDVNAPYVIGSLWNATAPPPLPSPVPQVRVLQTLVGNRIVITETPPTITIVTPSGQMVQLSPAGVQVVAGDSMVNVTPAGVAVTSKTISLAATSAVTITAPTVSIKSTGATNIQSGGTCAVTAPMVRIN